MALPTLSGDIEQLLGAAEIGSVGYAALDGWTDVLQFPGAQLPSGDGTYTFVVFGTIGNPRWKQPYHQLLTRIEIGLGTQAPGVFGGFKMSCNLWPFNNQGQVESAAFPFCFIIDGATDSTALNQTANSLTLKARIEGSLQKAADPKVIPLGAPTFEVMSATIMVWDREVLSGSDSRFDSVNVNRLATGYVGKSGGDWDSLGSGPANFGATGEDWMVFHSIMYEPAGAIQGGSAGTWHATHFRLQHIPTSGPEKDLVGFQQSAGRIPSGTGFHGTAPMGFGLGASGAGLSKHHNQHQTGGFHLATNVSDAFKYELFVRQEHDNTAPRVNFFSYVYRWRTFAVRLSALAFVHAYDRETLQNLDPIPLAFPYWQTRRNLSEVREFANGDWSEYMMMATATHRQSGAQGIAPAWHLDLSAADVPSDLVATQGPPVMSRFHEGIPILSAARVPTFRPAANHATLDLSLWKRTAGPATKQDGIADDASWIGWYFETDPENLAFPNEGRGAEVALIPDGEADATSLPTWPVSPTNSWSEEPQLPLEELRTPGGYRITWPLFLIPRDRRTWEWRGMTKAERDTLQTFIEDNADTALKWQGPHDTTDRIYVPVGPFSHTEIPGGLFNAQLSGIELVYGTAITPRVIT